MKKTIITSFILIFAINIVANAQDCFKYFPQKEGTKMETKHYDKKDKETSISVLTILKKTNNAGEQRIDLRVESFSKEMDSIPANEFAYICKNGKTYVDMTSYMGAQLSQYQAMEMEVDAGELELPTNPKAGQTLPDGNVTVAIKNNGIQIMKISMKIFDRKVEKLENLTTPAGTFKCFKLTQSSETKILFMKVKGSTAEWYAEGIGVVRSESYDKKGKLVSYSVLNKITK